VECPEVPSEKTDTTPVFAVYCLGLYCRAEGSHIVSDYCLGCRSNSWEVANSTVMRKWKLLFVHHCEWNSRVSTVTEFLDSYQGGTNTYKCSGIMLKNNNTSVE